VTAKPVYPVPRRTATIGMLLFLAALAMLFASGMLGYFIIRHNAVVAQSTVLRLPPMLWLSTAVLLISSFTAHHALTAVRAERRSAFRRSLLFTLALAITFLAIQGPALVHLLQLHWQLRPAGVPMYGLLFFLILLHAMHVVGGVGMLVWVTLRAHRGEFDHENHTAVRHTAWYWHFLDAIWIVMFLSIWLAG
jgi:cytochrome c oxidase subunit III